MTKLDAKLDALAKLDGTGGRKNTDERVDAMIAEYQRTGKRPAEWTRQALHQVLKNRGLR